MERHCKMASAFQFLRSAVSVKHCKMVSVSQSLRFVAQMRYCKMEYVSQLLHFVASMKQIILQVRPAAPVKKTTLATKIINAYRNFSVRRLLFLMAMSQSVMNDGDLCSI